MTDYLQKARELLPVDYSKCVANVATTLEALDMTEQAFLKTKARADKAEAERDALLEAVHMAKLELGSHGPCVACSNAHSILKTSTLIQPEPDPLVKLGREMVVADGTVRTKNQQDAIREGRAAQEAAAEHERRLRASLARHGLAVKEADHGA